MNAGLEHHLSTVPLDSMLQEAFPLLAYFINSITACAPIS